MSNLLNKYSNKKNVKKGMNVLLCGTILSPVIIPSFLELNNKALQCVSTTNVASTQPSLFGMTVAYLTVFCGGAASMILAAGEEKKGREE